MRDIAERAGVHPSTVSLALREHPSIPKETRERIQRLAAEMGYRPDPAMSALASYRKAHSPHPAAAPIAFVINARNEAELHESHVHPQLIQSARERAEELGYKLEVFGLESEYPHSAALDRVLQARGIQGVILGALWHRQEMVQLDWDRYAVVKINQEPRELPLDTVASNQMRAVRLAMQRMRDKGLRRIGLAVAALDELHNNQLFTAGYFVEENDPRAPDFVPPLVFERRPWPDIRQEAVDWALRHQLDAVLCNWNNFDQVAARAAEALGRPCRYVPLDADAHTIRFGGVEQNHREVSRRAVNMIIGQLNTFRKGRPGSPMLSLVEPLWVDSTE